MRHTGELESIAVRVRGTATGEVVAALAVWPTGPNRPANATKMNLKGSYTNSWHTETALTP